MILSRKSIEEIREFITKIVYNDNKGECFMEQRTTTIWEAFSKQLKLFILSRVSDDALADDILQDAFIKIHSRIDTLKDNTKIESWIYQITRNTIIDHFRGQKNVSNEIQESIEEFNESPDNNPHQEVASGLKTMINELPERYRQALLLTEFQGLTQKELAQHLGLSVSGAKSRVQRARQKLKDMLMQCCHFEFDRYGTIIDYHKIECCCCAAYLANKSS